MCLRRYCSLSSSSSALVTGTSTTVRNAGWISSFFGGRSAPQKRKPPMSEIEKQMYDDPALRAQQQAAGATNPNPGLNALLRGGGAPIADAQQQQPEQPPEPATAHALCAACAEGDLPRVQDLIARGAPANISPNSTGLTALHTAAVAGHLAIVEALLAIHPRPPSPLITVNRERLTPLHAACAHNRIDVVKMLCERVRELNLKPFRDPDDKLMHSAIDIRANEEGVTPLHLAVKFAGPEIVEELLASGADPTLFTFEPEPQSPVSVACLRGDLKLLKMLFLHAIRLPDMSEKKIVELASPDAGTTPLQMAAGAGQLEVVKFLVEECDADPRHVSELCPHPPLYLAAYSGHPNVVRYLLEERKIKPDEQLVGDGASALHAACKSGCVETATLLIEHGADKMLRRTKSGIVPAHVACLNGHLAIVKMLFPPATMLPPLPLVEHNNYTCLHLAIAGGPHEEVFHYLLQVGFEPELRVRADDRKLTPLHLAAEAGHTNITKMILEKVGKEPGLVDARDTIGITPLHAAANSGSIDCVQMLLESGADMSLGDRAGQTPILLAKEAGHISVVELMQRHAMESAGGGGIVTGGGGYRPGA